jgi:SH3 domain-containing YSC84-like protein 1
MRVLSISRRGLARMAGIGVGGLSLNATILGAFPAFGATDQSELVHRAYGTMWEAQHDPQFGNSPDLFQTAKAVLIVPQLVKAGFFLGGEGGDGVLLARHGSGWSGPAFCAMGSASFGFQIGVEVAELILFVMSDRALQSLMRDEIKLGAQAGLTVLVLGTNMQAATTARGDFDLVAWSKSKGAYAGLTLEGSIIKSRPEWNAAYYGRPITSRQALRMASRQT